MIGRWDFFKGAVLNEDMREQLTRKLGGLAHMLSIAITDSELQKSISGAAKSVTQQLNSPKCPAYVAGLEGVLNDLFNYLNYCGTAGEALVSSMCDMLNSRGTGKIVRDRSGSGADAAAASPPPSPARYFR